MLNLMLHCGSRGVTREQVACAATPPRSDTWCPIPHDRLLEQVQTTLAGNGLTVVNEAHALSPDGDRYFGLLELASSPGDAGDYRLVVGVRNSHDKTYPAGLALGSAVTICDNLAFSGEISLARRHTAHIDRDLPAFVQRAVGRLGDLRTHQDRRIDAYRNTSLSDPSVHDLAVRAVDARVVPVTRLPAVLEQWREPRHPEQAEGGKTAWRFFNAVTETIKGRSLDELPRRTQALHGLLDARCGLHQAIDAREEVDDVLTVSR